MCCFVSYFVTGVPRGPVEVPESRIVTLFLWARLFMVAQGGKIELRRVRVPAHRYTPLKENWEAVMTPIVEHLKLQIRMNTKTRTVELKVCSPHSHRYLGSAF